MKYFCILTFFLIFLSELTGVQLNFHNRTVFIADFVGDDNKTITVNYKGTLYKIPKSDLESYDLSKKGDNYSYNLIEWELKDGSKLRGEFVEENRNSVIINTNLGFLAIEKSKIKQIPVFNEPKPVFPLKYKAPEQVLPSTIIGLNFNYQYLIPGWNDSKNSLMGAGLFIEPAFLSIYGLNLGIKLDYRNSLPETNFGAISSLVYGIYFPFFLKFEGFNPYIQFGAGFSSIHYNLGIGSGGNRSGILPTTELALGIDFSIKENIFLRSSINSLCFFEKEGLKCGLGFELSGGLRL